MKRYSILITNLLLNEYTGSETWTYAMAKELSKEHDVTVFSENIGLMSDKLDCKVITKYEGEYDFAIINHIWNKVPDEMLKIFTSHSLVYDSEQFPQKCKHRVGVTEAVARGNTVIRNGIDCERFKPTTINKELKNILYLSNTNYAGGLEFVKEACKGYNLEYIKENTFDIEEYIDRADLVITLGRGALESMASGKNVIYGDFRKDFMECFKGGGLITPETYNKFKTGIWQENREEMSIKELREELGKYNKEYGEFNRKMILEDFNIKKTAKQYIDIWTNFKKGI